MSACVSAVAAPAWAHGLEPIAVEFRLLGNDAAVEAIAWRRGDEIYAAAETLRALGISASTNQSEPSPLSDIAGLSYRFVEADQAVEITCASACFAHQRVRAADPEMTPLQVGVGGFLNADLVATYADEGGGQVSGAFDLGLFRPGGRGAIAWLMGAEAGALIRLDTAWTFDRPNARQSVRLGDALAPATASGAAFRFAGVQWGTEFAVDPSFVPFPLPTFSGEAAAPSVVDLYINGALQTRQRVDAGPFDLTDTPVIAGGGVAQLVVTDALGRQQNVTAPFYASPSLLRAGLTDFSVAAGATRRNFARASFDYGDAFALGAYRHGVTDWLTAEARLEVSGGASLVGAGLALARPTLGEVNVRVAHSETRLGDGQSLGMGWAWQGARFSFAIDAETTSDDFSRLGQEDTARRRAQGTIGWALGRYGALSLAAASQETTAFERVETWSLGFAPPAGRLGALAINALHVDDGEQAFTTASVTFVRPLGRRGSASTAVQSDADGISVRARAQRATPAEGGWGWRIGAAQGETRRWEAAAALRARAFEARLEAAHAAGADGLRGQFESALVWIDGATMIARPIRDSFALVDVGVAQIGVLHDRRLIGRTDQHGRLLVTGLRSYDQNRLGVSLDDLPIEASIAQDEVAVRTGARSGVRVDFAVAEGRAGEVRIVDENNDALPEGAVLVRDTDLARFPIGGDGRAYLSAVVGISTLVAEAYACRVVVTSQALDEVEPLRCVR
ncbi:sigma-fimbriae usher protein [alpha proteobacterium U9-1i]|nr:sigma-fimbriae usher protein [alpha proteobacterium U9-1i]